MELEKCWKINYISTKLFQIDDMFKNFVKNLWKQIQLKIVKK
jgi:hypothetical protein